MSIPIVALLLFTTKYTQQNNTYNGHIKTEQKTNNNETIPSPGVHMITLVLIN